MHNPRVLVLSSTSHIEAEMASIGVDPIGASIMLPKASFRLLKIEGLRTAAANIVKLEMLAKGGEAALSWSSSVASGETTGVLMLGTLRHYQRLVERLAMLPFGLRGLADEITQALDNWDGTPSPTPCGGTTFTWGARTYVMGIVNLTPDSFSGDGLGKDIESAVAQAVRFVEEGADLLDIGGESTRPGHTAISIDEEIRRVIPALIAIRRAVPVPLSIDTYKPRVAEAALTAGANMVNDVWGLKKDLELARVAAEHRAPLILMHNQEGTEYTDLMAEVVRSLRESVTKARQAGLPDNSILVDPGIGFGKRREQNLEVLARLSELRVLGHPILLGTSRKSTIGHILGRPPQERREGTAATVALGIANGADIVRVHDVREMARVARMSDAITRGRWQQYS
ncbi:MAG: dihydropteroate synthase [Chloroflexota bacterium]